jgi:SAM-dependent methyltransferase
MGRAGPVEIAEGFYLAQVVYYLHRHDVFERLHEGRTVASLAGELGYDRELMGELLEFVYQATDILARFGSSGYRLNTKYEAYSSLGFHIDKFIGAYGSAISRLDEVLRSPALGKHLVNEQALMQAFAQLDRSASQISATIIRMWKIPSLLDLGCGTCTLLRDLCLTDTSFEGWGIDVNEHMCVAARELARAEGLDARLHIIRGDVRALERHLEPVARKEIAAVHGGSILNEFFRDGPRQASLVVGMLKELMPNRLLFVTDYYGKLGRLKAVKRRYRHTLIQDVAQAVSGQGVPPADLEGWSKMYEAADCRVLQAYHGTGYGLDWFVHVVQL